jgi:hypothetical protein
MDPITISLAVGVASKAFEAIKSGFAMGVIWNKCLAI